MISAMLCKDTLIPPRNGGGEGFCIPPPSPLDAPVQTKPPQTQNCITRVFARALLLIAGFKPKKAGKKCKNMIFWGRGLPKTFSLPKIPYHPHPDMPEVPSMSPPYGYRSSRANKPHIEEEGRVGKPAGLGEAGARKALNKPEKSWDLLVCSIRPSVLPAAPRSAPQTCPDSPNFGEPSPHREGQGMGWGCGLQCIPAPSPCTAKSLLFNCFFPFFKPYS